MTTQTDSGGWRDRFDAAFGTPENYGSPTVVALLGTFRAFVEEEKSLSERQGAEKVLREVLDAVSTNAAQEIIETVPNETQASYLRCIEHTEVILKKRLARTQEVEGEPFGISK